MSGHHIMIDPRLHLGALVRTRKGLVWHVGRVSSVSPLRIRHNSNAYGGLVDTSVQAFEADSPAQLFGNEAPHVARAQLDQMRPRSAGKRYDLTNNNCETSAFGHSPTVRGLAKVGVVGFGLYLVLRSR